MRVVAVLLLERVWTFFHDDLYYLSELFGTEVFEFLLELHFLMVGYLLLLFLLVHVVLYGFSLVIFACAKLSCMMEEVLPGMMMGMEGR